MSEDEEFEFRARAEEEERQRAAASNLTTPPASAAENVATYGAQAALPLTVGGPNLTNVPPGGMVGPVKPGTMTAPGPLTRTAIDVAKDVPGWVKPLSNLSVGEAIKYVGKEGLTKSAADLAGAILHPLRDVSVGSVARNIGTGVTQGLMAPENLMTLPYNMAAYERANIRANPNAPEYADNPYAMTVRGQAPTQAAAGAMNQRRALIGQQYGGLNPEEQAVMAQERQRQLNIQKNRAIINQPPTANNFIERMKAISDLYGGIGQ